MYIAMLEKQLTIPGRIENIREQSTILCHIACVILDNMWTTMFQMFDCVQIKKVNQKKRVACYQQID